MLGENAGNNRDRDDQKSIYSERVNSENHHRHHRPDHILHDRVRAHTFSDMRRSADMEGFAKHVLQLAWLFYVCGELI